MLPRGPCTVYSIWNIIADHAVHYMTLRAEIPTTELVVQHPKNAWRLKSWTVDAFIRDPALSWSRLDDAFTLFHTDECGDWRGPDTSSSSHVERKCAFGVALTCCKRALDGAAGGHILLCSEWPLQHSIVQYEAIFLLLSVDRSSCQEGC